MQRREIHKDVLTLIRASTQDRDGCALMIRHMPEEDRQIVMADLIGFGAAMLAIVAAMTGRTPEEMIQGLGEILDVLDP